MVLKRCLSAFSAYLGDTIMISAKAPQTSYLLCRFEAGILLNNRRKVNRKANMPSAYSQLILSLELAVYRSV